MNADAFDDMHGSFVRATSPRFSGIALEANEGFIQRAIKAFREFIDRIIGWFREHFGRKPVVDTKVVEAVREAYKAGARSENRNPLKTLTEVINTSDQTRSQTKTWLDGRYIDDIHKGVRVSYDSDPAGYFGACVSYYVSYHMARYNNLLLNETIFDKRSHWAPDFEKIPTISEFTHMAETLGGVEAKLASLVLKIHGVADKSPESIANLIEGFWSANVPAIERDMIRETTALVKKAASTSNVQVNEAFRGYLAIFDHYNQMGGRMVKFLETYVHKLASLKVDKLDECLKTIADMAEKDTQFAQALSQMTELIVDISKAVSICTTLADSSLAFTKTYLTARYKSAEYTIDYYKLMGKNDSIDDHLKKEMLTIISNLEEGIKKDKEILSQFQ